MELPETPRKFAAAGTASVVFAGSYVGLSLAWWLSVVLALLVFGLMLRIIGLRAPTDDERVPDGIARSDLDAANDALSKASATMRRLAERAREEERKTFARLADLFEAIRAHHLDDPGAYQHTRRFVRRDTPRIVDTAETYVALSGNATVTDVVRIREMGERIRQVVPVLEKIDQACLESDVMMIEVQIDVLGHLLEPQ